MSVRYGMCYGSSPSYVMIHADDGYGGSGSGRLCDRTEMNIPSPSEIMILSLLLHNLLSDNLESVFHPFYPSIRLSLYFHFIFLLPHFYTLVWYGEKGLLSPVANNV
jgi:hypothetical protein